MRHDCLEFLEREQLAKPLLAFVAGLRILASLTRFELGEQAARRAVVLLCLAPASFFFSAIYTESLLLAIPLAIMLWQDRVRPRRTLLSLAALPATLVAYLTYLAALGYSPLSPFVQPLSSAHAHQLGGPFMSAIAGLRAAANGLGALLSGAAPVYTPSAGGPLSRAAQSVVLFAVLIADLCALRLVYRRLPRAYFAYTLATLIVCTWSPTSQQQLQSLDRYTPRYSRSGWCAAAGRQPAAPVRRNHRRERSAARLLRGPVRDLGLRGLGRFSRPTHRHRIETCNSGGTHITMKAAAWNRFTTGTRAMG